MINEQSFNWSVVHCSLFIVNWRFLMLMPKKVKHRKQHRGRRRGKASGGFKLDFGDYGLQALESCWMSANQIEAARIAMTRHIKRGGKIWIRVFPDKPF